MRNIIIFGILLVMRLNYIETNPTGGGMLVFEITENSAKTRTESGLKLISFDL
jgi:hypothetical protein